MPGKSGECDVYVLILHDVSTDMYDAIARRVFYMTRLSYLLSRAGAVRAVFYMTKL